MKSLITLIIVIIFMSTATGQLANRLDRLDVNDLTAKKLNVVSTTAASKPCPLMTQVQRDAIVSPLEGQCVYNSSTKTINIFDGSAWVEVAGSGGGISEWVSGLLYEVGDVVISGNDIFQCIVEHTSGASFDPSKFQILAQDLSSTVGVLSMAKGGTDKSLTPELGGIVYTDNGSMEVLSAGVLGKFLQSNGAAAPSWESVVINDSGFSGVLSMGKGGTNKNLTASNGAVPYSDADSFELLAPGSSGQVLKSNGASAPSWAAVDDSLFSGNLSLSKGGTSKSLTASNGAIAYSDSDSLELLPPGTNGKYLKSNGASAPSWENVTQNYIFQNSDFEINDAGWVEYKDASSEVPEDGTGGAFTISFAETTTTPLRGLKSGLLTKPATVSRLGEGFSYNFTIDPADQSQVLRINFDYSTTVNYTDGDIRIYVYDVTNSQLIEVIDRDLYASAQGKYSGTFQSSSNSTSYRLIFHITDSSLDSWNVEIDNVFVGQQNIVKGAIVTDWENFTPTGSWSGVTYSGYKRRVGNALEVNYSLTVTNSTLISGTLDFTVPDNLSIDTTLVLNSTTSYFGQGLTNIGVTNHIAARFVSQTSIRAIALSAGGTYVGYANVTNTVPAAPANGDVLQLRVMIPIQGWSSNVTLSEDAGNRKIYCLADLKGTNQAISTSGNTQVALSKTVDTTNSFDDSTGRWYAPESGEYDISASVYLTGLTTTDNSWIGIYKNGALEGQQFLTGQATGSRSIAKTLNLSKGDYVRLFVSTPTDTSYSIDGTDYRTYLTISKRSSPQTIAASEVVHVSASALGGSIGTVANIYNYSTKTIDTHNAYNSGVFTAPQTGYYNVTAALRIDATALTTSQNLLIQITKNGTSTLTRSLVFGNGASITPSVSVSYVVYLAKDEFIDIRTSCSQATTAVSTSGWNTLSITKINGVN